MALWLCRNCGSQYAVGLEYCPQCTSTDHEEAGMPKISVAGGPSNAAAGDGAEVPVEEAQPVGDVNADDEVASYEKLTKPELQAELEQRGLPKSGNVPDLIERLEADDAAKAEAAASEAEEVPAPPAADEPA